MPALIDSLCMYLHLRSALYFASQRKLRPTWLQEYMVKISHLCNERVAELTAEEGGEALLAFHAPPKEAAGIHQILRQDHPEVLVLHHLICETFSGIFAHIPDTITTRSQAPPNTPNL
jgi:hypothetical protein